MGNYLERPVLDLDTEQGTNNYLSYGCSSVQGWRCTQEDAHSATLDLVDGLSFFAVYDGHGGKEVAQFCASALPSQFVSETAFTVHDNIGRALYDAFLSVDASLLTPAVKSQLERLAEPKTENKTSSENGDCELKGQKSQQKTKLVRGRRRHRRKKQATKEGNIFDGLDAESKQLIVDEVLRLVTELEIKHCMDALLSSIDPSSEVISQSDGVTEEVDSGQPSCTNDTMDGKPDLVALKEDELEPTESSNIKKRPSSDIHSPSSSPSKASPIGQPVNSPAKSTASVERQSKDMFRHEENVPPLTKASDEGAKKPRRESGDRHPVPESRRSIATDALSDDKKGTATAREDETAKLEVADEHASGGSPVVSLASECTEQATVDESGDSGRATALPTELAETAIDNDDDNEACDEHDDYEMGAAQKELIMSELRTFRLLRELGPIRVIRPQKRNPGMNSGCTAIVAVITENKRLIVANAGDSRAVLCRGGIAMPLSKDHNPEVQEERDRIEKAGHEITADGRVDGGLNLSRSLGDHTYKDNTKLPAESQAITCKPDICEMEILPEDEFIVLACDGIWNCKSNQEVCDMVRSRLGSTSLGEICEEICSLCIAPSTDGDGTGCDNMTLMVVTFKPYTYKGENRVRSESASKKPCDMAIEDKPDVEVETVAATASANSSDETNSGTGPVASS